MNIKRFVPDCSIHMSHEIAFMRETPEGKYVEFSNFEKLLVESAAMRRLLPDFVNCPTTEQSVNFFMIAGLRYAMSRLVNEQIVGRASMTTIQAFTICRVLDAFASELAADRFGLFVADDHVVEKWVSKIAAEQYQHPDVVDAVRSVKGVKHV
ncbi:hypothetical protein [Dickeya fangzhongdai]|uniref:hypothetical protein n=1 Tax=Dickeya fangzhongdai TaxID=1778540 RepID=UPI001ADB7FDC|nr:hypothetical protein [Dickeya fangzhongdai]MBO8135536.1 hypothetical protein [Dickeya fangzhongdai]